MSISDHLTELIPIGEENAVSGLLLWKQLKMWSPASIKHNLRLGIVHVPTPPMGLYSKKHPLGAPIKPGSTVAVPNDPSICNARCGSCATSP